MLILFYWQKLKSIYVLNLSIILYFEVAFESEVYALLDMSRKRFLLKISTYKDKYFKNIFFFTIFIIVSSS